MRSAARGRTMSQDGLDLLAHFDSLRARGPRVAAD